MGIAVLVYTLIGFLVAPLILKAVLEKKLPLALNRPMTIETVRLNSYALSLTIEGFALAEKEGPDLFVFFDRLYVNLESLSLFKKGLILQSISLKGPAIHVSRLDEKNFSFSDLLAAPAAEEPAEEKTTEPLPVNSANLAEALARMEAFLLQGIKIEDEELRLLALDRANTVLGYLIEPGKVEPGRFFVIEPHLARPEGEEAQESQTQVELLLK